MSGVEHTPTTRDALADQIAEAIVPYCFPLTHSKSPRVRAMVDDILGLPVLCQWEAEHQALWAEPETDHPEFPDDYSEGIKDGHNRLLARLRAAGTEAPK